MRTRRITLSIFAGLAVLVTVVLVAACGAQSPSPEDSPSNRYKGKAVDLDSYCDAHDNRVYVDRRGAVVGIVKGCDGGDQ